MMVPKDDCGGWYWEDGYKGRFKHGISLQNLFHIQNTMTLLPTCMYRDI
jgi:hypothetical protein